MFEEIKNKQTKELSVQSSDLGRKKKSWEK